MTKKIKIDKIEQRFIRKAWAIYEIINKANEEDTINELAKAFQKQEKQFIKKISFEYRK